jgi:MFS transporter, NNP family, nitrate/nitrite transporter
MLEPLQDLQVWRFSLYYFFVFGAFVALALWMPRYLIGVYGLDIATAGMVGAAYSIPASIFRAYGGHLSDKFGARRIMYWTFGVSVICTFILSYPPTTYVVEGIRGPNNFSTRMSVTGFIVTTFVLGFFMSLGKAAVFKHIPVYYPPASGAVGGIVGLVGGLGGFVLPIAFGAFNDLTGIAQSCFWLLFAVVSTSLVWMNFAIRNMEQEAARSGVPSTSLPELPEMQPIHTPDIALRKALVSDRRQHPLPDRAGGSPPRSATAWNIEANALEQNPARRGRASVAGSGRPRLRRPCPGCRAGRRGRPGRGRHWRTHGVRACRCR